MKGRTFIYREAFILASFILVSLITFVFGSMLTNASHRISQQAQKARLELVQEGHPFRDVGFVKTKRQVRYEQYGTFLSRSSLFILLGYVVSLAIRSARRSS